MKDRDNPQRSLKTKKKRHAITCPKNSNCFCPHLRGFAVKNHPQVEGHPVSDSMDFTILLYFNSKLRYPVLYTLTPYKTLAGFS